LYGGIAMAFHRCQTRRKNGKQLARIREQELHHAVRTDSSGAQCTCLGEIGWWRIVVAGVAFSIFLYFHGQLFSVSPIAAT